MKRGWIRPASFFIGANMRVKYHKDDSSGIYIITCLSNGKSYIGQSFHAMYRCRTHFAMLKGNKHKNRCLQNSFNKYGAKNFTYRVAKTCSVCDLNDSETELIAKYGRENLFNYTDGGEGLKGYVPSADSTQKCRLTKIARWADDTYTTEDMAIRRINVFTGQKTLYSRIGAAEKDGFSKKTIASCLCGIKRTHKGFFWQRAVDTTEYEALKNNLNKLSLQQAKSYYTFAMLLDGNDPALPEPPKFVPKRLGGTPKKRIERIDVITGVVIEYESVAEAGRDGFDRSTIQRALRGEIATYRGFYWAVLN